MTINELRELLSRHDGNAVVTFGHITDKDPLLCNYWDIHKRYGIKNTLVYSAHNGITEEVLIVGA